MEKPHLPKDTEWPEATEKWFNNWRDSERTDGWDMPQWQYMFDTAIVHALVYQAEQYQCLGELRARLREMGLSFEQIKKKPEIKVTPISKIMEAYSNGHSRSTEASS